MTTRRSRMLATIGMLCAIGGVAVTQAPPPSTIEAEQLFRDGKRLMDAGDYRQACEAFEGSLRKDPAAD